MEKTLELKVQEDRENGRISLNAVYQDVTYFFAGVNGTNAAGVLLFSRGLIVPKQLNVIALCTNFRDTYKPVGMVDPGNGITQPEFFTMGDDVKVTLGYRATEFLTLLKSKMG